MVVIFFNIGYSNIFSVKLIKNTKNGDFLGGIVVENPPASARDMGSSPGPGRSHVPRSN